MLLYVYVKVESVNIRGRVIDILYGISQLGKANLHLPEIGISIISSL
jgi:hypothetical protein